MRCRGRDPKCFKKKSLFSRYKIGIIGYCGSDVWYSKMVWFFLDGEAFELAIVKHKGFSSNDV